MEFLIATILSCESAEDIISRIPSNESRAELVQQVKMSTEEGCFEDAKADWRNGDLKTLLLWRKPMAQVTYRGVEYDTEEYRKMLIEEHDQRRNHDLMYRGIKVRSKAIPCSWTQLKGGVDTLLFLWYNYIV